MGKENNQGWNLNERNREMNMSENIIDQLYRFEGQPEASFAETFASQVKTFSRDVVVYRQRAGDAEVQIITAERYYARTNSATGVTITLFIREREITAYVAVMAGGYGPFNVSWGNYENYLEKVEKLLLSYAFKRIPDAAGVRP